MATIADVTALGYTAAPEGAIDGVTLYRIEGFGMPLVLAREDDADALQAIVDRHPARQAAQTRRANRDALATKLATARDVFRTNYTNWATLTNAQKDTANRNAQRALANLVQIALDQLDDQGV